MYRLFSFIIIFSFTIANAQDVKLPVNWKFGKGDSASWSAPLFNDSSWPSIRIGDSWENQGYSEYNGFAWYRTKIILPSSIREKAFLKDKIRFDLGKIDDGDEVYLNGYLIGRNGGRQGDIKSGSYDVYRSYIVSATDPKIYWDRENVIAVRVYDSGGNGGMYEGRYGISMVDITDYVKVNIDDNGFTFPGVKQVAKKITLESTNERYDFTGKLRIVLTDPETNVVVTKETIGVDFAKGRPFEYTFKSTIPENKAYQLSYVFEENRTKKEISRFEQVPYILTPIAGAVPKINGPAVYGVRPNAPFLYRIPATGEVPKTYSASGLPKGLSLNPKTGIIAGSIAAKGKYKLNLLVTNKAGVAKRSFTVVCGDDIALTPVMGWNSWNCWALSVSDQKVRLSAQNMNEKLANYGWSFINIDDGWEKNRNASGEIVANEKFPNMKELSDYVHSLGLKIGIYSSPGRQTCGGYLGSYEHEEQDATTYGNWNIDYLKYDWCSYEQIAPHQPSLQDYQKPYRVMRTALDKVHRDIVFSFCQYGMGDIWKWGAATGGNSWRTTGDINDSWSSLSEIGFSQTKAAAYAQPGHFNDPDMLVVGKVGWGPNLHPTKLTPDEQYTHISLWSLLSAPLLIGCDMTSLDPFTLNLLTNAEVLAIDQDALGKSAERMSEQAGIQVWLKRLENGTHAIGIFNTANKVSRATIKFSDLQLGEKLKLRNVWMQKDLGEFQDTYSCTIPAHGVVLLNLKSIGTK